MPKLNFTPSELVDIDHALRAYARLLKRTAMQNGYDSRSVSETADYYCGIADRVIALLPEKKNA
jgi:hypothetical protein